MEPKESVVKLANQFVLRKEIEFLKALEEVLDWALDGREGNEDSAASDFAREKYRVEEARRDHEESWLGRQMITTEYEAEEEYQKPPKDSWSE